MHLVLLHGYLLRGTGSNVYVANVAKAWRAQGHAVTIVCQDRDAGKLPFVDELISPDQLVPDYQPESGQIRVVVPAIDGLLPVYVLDHYEGFVVKTIPELTESETEIHIAMTAAAVRAVAAQGVDRLLANHVLLGPVIARRALSGTDVPYDVKLHGSAIEYTLVPTPRLLPLAVEGLREAERVFVGSNYVRQRVLGVFESEPALRLSERVTVVPPGMDPDLFRPRDDSAVGHRRFVSAVRTMIAENGSGRHGVDVVAPKGEGPDQYHRTLVTLGETYDQRAVDSDLPERWPDARPDDPMILYVGKFLGVKGVGELMAAAPEIIKRVPRVHLVFAGFGEYREHLEGMVRGFIDDDRDWVAACAAAGGFAEEAGVGRWFRRLLPDEAERITITGILDHETLGELLPLASLSVVPSKWPEAFGMVAVEAMAAGVLPLCAYHAGLRDIVDEVERTMPEAGRLMKLDRDSLAVQIPDRVEEALRYLFPDGFDQRARRREVGRELRDIATSRFSWDRIGRRLLA